MFLSQINIKNFKGIKLLEISFDSKLNIIIGENGCCKTAVIDAIRLLYNQGNQKRDIYVTNDDFHFEGGVFAKKIELTYSFRGLSSSEKGALYEYMILDKTDPEKDYAQITIIYELQEKGYPKFSYYTGNNEEQKADSGTFDIFQHYYLGALRDSTTDLSNTKTNVLGTVIKRIVERNNSQDAFKKIINDANAELLKRQEVKDTRSSVNTHLENIFKISNDNKIGLRIEEASKLEGIVNVIKPYLPHDKALLEKEGFNLWQNSLGYNNLIYIAIILGDIKERIQDNPNQHYILLIEEPEAHLHPQLQLNLYNFLKDAGKPNNCQLFITSHSPTLTSKANLDNIISLRETAVNIGGCFHDRETEKIIEKVAKKVILKDADFAIKKRQLQRYLDVTKSQMFFARSILFVEGISEKLLLKAFAEKLSVKLEDHRCEIVSVDGISFYPFIHLFNSVNPNKKLSHKVSIITDDDRLSKAKNSFNNLTNNKYLNLNAFHSALYKAGVGNRMGNLKSTLKSSINNGIFLFSAFKTLEYEIAFANVENSKTEFYKNFLVTFVSTNEPTKFAEIKAFIDTLPNENFSDVEIQKIAILLWKSLPSKAEFAQNFSLSLEEAIATGKSVNFIVPPYLENAIKHATS